MSVLLISSISCFAIGTCIYAWYYFLNKPTSIHKYIELMDKQNVNTKIDDELILKLSWLSQ